MKPFAVDRREHDQTLAAVLRNHCNFTWSQAKQIIESRRVKLAGQTCADPARRVRTGQTVTLAETELKSTSRSITPRTSRPGATTRPNIVVRYFDDDILVVEKPPGLTTMRSSQETAEFGRGKKYLPKTLEHFLPAMVGDHLPIIAVHRIDKDTSGLVIFARNGKAEKHLNDQFRGHAVERKYLAIVRGTPTQSRVESSIVRDRGDGRRGSGSSEQGQRAITHVQVIERLGALTLVECRLETGRTHQVRIHLGEMGCPLAGEKIYDRPVGGAPVADPSGAKRFLLHAAELGITHPKTGRKLRWQSALPEDMQTIIDQLRS